ncbi:sigma-70 family RNA polymerase sigma factor [Pelomicrobium sp.]|uniref:sigma-70 family RNA polymerase sigma factor n=1 Tax=Pelomicrobium sp. TaxID=2815319 RepID=UPI002FDCC05E
MKTHLSYHHLGEPSRPRLQQMFSEQAAEVERRLKDFSPDLVHLEGRIEKNPNHALYRAGLRLKLPSTVLSVVEEGRDLPAVLAEAFEELLRRTDKHLARLRREALWKRSERRRRLREQVKSPPQTREAERRRLYFTLIESHLDALYGYVQRELLYLESAGVLAPGELSAEDLVDTVVLRGLEAFEERPLHLAVPQWLIALAMQVVAEELERLRRDRLQARLSLEEPPPRPAEEPTRRDEERFDYWEPDERLRLEDLVPLEEAPTPEQAQMRREMRLALHRAIALLPRAWRQAVVLTALEEVAQGPAAEVLGMDEPTLAESLAHAYAFLREKLKDAGFSAADIGPTLEEAVAPTMPLPMPAFQREAIAEVLGMAAAPDSPRGT